MARSNHLLSSFSQGEVSPRFFGRADTQEYKNCCEEMLNVHALHTGGFRNRNGTQFMADVGAFDANALTYARHIDFIPSSFFKYALVMIPGSTAAWGMFAFSGYSITLISSVSAAATSTWTTGDIQAAHYAQNGNLLYITAPGKIPLILKYNIDTGTFSLIAFYEARVGTFADADLWPYLELNALNNQGNGTLTCSGTSGSITVTSSAGIFFPGGASSPHVGARFKISSGGVTGHFYITSVTNATTAVATVASTLPTTSAVGSAAGTSWEESAWSNYRGWPRTVTMFEGRVYFAGTTSYPFRTWMSQAGDLFELMERPFEQSASYATYTDYNTRAWAFDVALTEPNAILWLSGGKKLFIGTSYLEFVAGGSGVEIFGPLAADVKASTTFGSSFAQPVRVGNNVVFCQRSGEQLRDTYFSFEEDEYKSDPLNLLADHIVHNKDDHAAYSSSGNFVILKRQSAPETRLWVLTNTYQVYTCTISKELRTIAWSRQEIGGVYTTGKDPEVFSIGVVPYSAVYGSNDTITLMVRRKINGVTKVFLEVIEEPGRGYTLDKDRALFTTLDEMVYCDSSLVQWTSPASKTWTVAHLPNTEVVVIGDDQYLGKFTTDGSGIVTLPNAVKRTVIGLAYTSRVTTVDLDFGGQIGTAKGITKGIHELDINFYRTVGASYGKKGDKIYDIPWRPADTPSNEPTPLYTGLKKVSLGGIQRDIRVVIEQNKPLPLEVTSITCRGQSYD